MKTITDRLNINIHKVIDAVGTKPFGYRKFSPGPGVGGHVFQSISIYELHCKKRH